jgi:hypothetical protein
MIRKLFVFSLITGLSLHTLSQTNPSTELYYLNNNLRSRSISFENPSGQPGEGGKAASEIGIGRKGAPRKSIKPKEEVILFDIKHSGTIRHIWLTGEWSNPSWLKDHRIERAELLRSIVIRAYWDGQEYPSIECPLGDFMGLAHSKITAYESSVHSIGKNGALNIWLPMPFAQNAKITLTNESDIEFLLYYQIDYTIGDNFNNDFGRLHVCFRRENPTTIKDDFEIMPKREGKGRFIGAVLGVRTLHPGWWGEGEVKFYMDGDKEFPTICGTGTEDWIGLSYGIQQVTCQFQGCNLNFKSDSTSKAYDYVTKKMVEMKTEYISMYRWYISDPIYWNTDCRVTIQQIGCCYYERKDDWSAAAFWYEPIPSAPLPEMPSVEERIKNLDELHRNER